MKWLWNKIKEEPAAAAAIINIILIQAIAYGFTISPPQLANWNMIVALILGFLTRKAVVAIPVANSQIQTAIKLLPNSATVEDVIAINKKEKEGE